MSLLRETYRFLKKHRTTSSALHLFDIPIFRKIDAIDFPLCIRAISNHWVTSHYENDIRNAFRQICKQFDLHRFYDVGANVGIFAADFLMLHPTNQAWAFEPNPHVFKCLMKTKEKNALQRLHISESALSNVDGHSMLTFDPLSPAKGGLHPIQNGKYTHELHYGGVSVQKQVRVTSLDIFCHSHPLPDVIKIDAEGEELAIFQGGIHILSEHHPILFFECSKDHQEIEELLRKIDYRLFDVSLKPVDFPSGFNIAIPAKLN